MIEFVEVTKRYKAVHALNNVCFQASEDDITGIIGHNGAGKTTLFMIANGLTMPSEGDVIIDGMSLSKDHKKFRSITAIFTDRMYLYPMLTVRECLSYFIGVYKAPKSKYEYLIESFQLKDHERKPFAALSTGLQKRLKLAISIVNDPKVLFLDEPFSGLDPEARYSLIQLIKDIKTRDIQILISSHDLLELETLVNRIVVLRGGFVIADDYMDTLIKAYFPEIPLNVEIYSKDINTLTAYMASMEITLDKILRNPNNVYILTISSGDYIRIESIELPGSKILSVTSSRPTLDDLYMKINRAFGMKV